MIYMTHIYLEDKVTQLNFKGKPFLLISIFKQELPMKHIKKTKESFSQEREYIYTVYKVIRIIKQKNIYLKGKVTA